MPHFVSEHTDNLVAHGFPCIGVEVEVDFNPIGRFADGFYKVGLFLFRCGGLGFICIHIGFLSRAFRALKSGYGFVAV